jgi:hypothetical protein
MHYKKLALSLNTRRYPISVNLGKPELVQTELVKGICHPCTEEGFLNPKENGNRG